MIGHPREAQLLAFQDHRLDDRRRRKLAGHLSGCQRCRNLIQSHRAVRGVFALEAPFAPDGVLERVLASRASGVAVVLPVAEPDTRRHGRDPLRFLAIAAGAVITVVAASQLVPTTSLRNAWGAWSAMIADWKPLGEGNPLDIEYLEAPVAKGAKLDPSRMRPMTVTYLLPPGRDGSVHRVHVEVKRVGAEWHVSRHSGGTSMLTSRFDTTALGLLGWTRVDRFGEHEYAKVYHLEREGTAFRYSFHWTGAPPAAFLQKEPPMQVTGEFDGFAERPAAVGMSGEWLLLSAAPLKLGWAGSLLELSSGHPPNSGWHPGVSTFLVTGSDRISTPFGSFDAWAVSTLLPAGYRYQATYWFRKSDGLLLKSQVGGVNAVSTLVDIEAVTYH
jgi:hypothetical protein